MKKKEIIRIIILVLIIILAGIRYHFRKVEFKQSEIILDTFIEINVVSKDKNVASTVEKAFHLIKRYENKLSYFDENSTLFKINESTSDSIMIDDDFYIILSLADDLYTKTDLLYDITIGELLDVWDFDKMIVPSEDAIQMALSKTDFNRISFTKNYLYNPQYLKITFGSIAKGFIIDKVVKFLQKNNVESGLINAGGDIKIFGKDKKIKIGIQHPRKEQNEVIEVVNIKNNSIVTSGDYERVFEFEGKRYHHILNPKTGYPTDEMISITVIHPSALIADAYATGLFLLKPEKAIELAEKNVFMEVILYYEKDSEIKSLQTSGMGKYLEN
ncbi:MAG: FAD:protein FMN transferase [Candidatus Cloacimonetes bacterium]|nr:FAD:protein FMN transferase [Candidatus Cloacimonadota bacterium]